MPPPLPLQGQNFHSQSLRLTDNDVRRIATKVKLLLRDEINDIVEQKITPLRKEFDTLKKSLSQIQNDLPQVKMRNDDFEQNQRLSCLRLFGIAAVENEDITKLDLDQAKRIGAKIEPQDIEQSHRVVTRTADDDRDISDSLPEPRKLEK